MLAHKNGMRKFCDKIIQIRTTTITLYHVATVFGLVIVQLTFLIILTRRFFTHSYFQCTKTTITITINSNNERSNSITAITATQVFHLKLKPQIPSTANENTIHSMRIQRVNIKTKTYAQKSRCTLPFEHS